MTDAQRDAQKVWTYLERLFDWAGTRSKPMPPSDLDVIREQVTENLDRIVDRADELERAPMLREVIEDHDGTKTVVIDMRDGSTRKFQTRVDWFDGAPTLADPVPAELIEVRDRIEEQAAIIIRSGEMCETLEGRIDQLEQSLARAEEELGEARYALSGADEREAILDVARAAAEEKIQPLLEEREEWKQRYTTAAKVIDESLPAIGEVLAERTAEVAKLKAEIESLR